ncbi:phage terminase large subunit [Salmonella enterica subsp. enterica]|uniref:Phage terminase large subunit n=1 Tax=Salmonella enterica I TaxID=59201 RepID=A0A379UMY5_SALET|nr:phage terminase large subunit [Salmonella enterica subsp. enterica]
MFFRLRILKCVALTDYDRFPEDVDGEGDAFSLASEAYHNVYVAGMTLVESSPGREITDTRWKPSITARSTADHRNTFPVQPVAIVVAGTGRVRIVANIFSHQWRI